MRFHVHERAGSTGRFASGRRSRRRQDLRRCTPSPEPVRRTARRPTRRRLLALAGAGAAALAGCGSQPGACSPGVPVRLVDVDVADGDGEWTLSGTVEATYRRTEGALSAVAVVAFDADGTELAHDEVGDLDAAAGESFDAGSCEGSRVAAPFELSTAGRPARVAVGGGAFDRACADGDLDVQPREYVRDDEGQPTDFEGGWTRRTRECGSATTESPEGELVAVTDESTDGNESTTETDEDGSTTAADPST